MYGLLRLGIAEIKSTSLVIIPLDKQPGFCLVSASTFSRMESTALTDKYYVPMPMSYVNHRSTMQSYQRLATRIAKHHGDARLSTRILSSTSGVIVAPLGITVKSQDSEQYTVVSSLLLMGFLFGL